MVLPFLLAGPIVRRVEPTLVSVWVATIAPCTVRLHVWPGTVSAGPGTGGTVFDPGGEAALGERQTLLVGAKIHIAVVSARIVGNQPLLPGERYSYNVTFDVAGEPDRDLHSLGLLTDRPEQQALGYQAGVLPSLATCPLTIEDLVLVHGSCNRIDAEGGPNLMFAIDEMIHASLDDPRHRPHQLWLTGDQVYSDEVAGTLSSAITFLGRELVGADELIELNVEGDQLRIPVRQANFPGGYRKQLMVGEAKLTSSEAASHLLGMTERLAMQLMLWSPEVWDRAADGAVLLPAGTAVLPSQEPPLLEALEDLPPGMSSAQAGAARVFLAKSLTKFGNAGELKAAVKQADDEAKQVLAYAAKVGVIRRALANVATYLVFDDHDVTDDWNLCQLWKDRVYGNGLGRSVIRDGLATFALTQGWGNDPGAYEGGFGAELLATIGRVFPDTGPGPVLAEAANLDRLLGLAGEPPLMRWHFQVDGAVHRVIACDTRTRRGYTGRVSPPVQLPDGERELQIPEGPLPVGIEMLVVVLSQPLLDPVLLGELTQGLIARGVAAFSQIHDTMLGPLDSRALAGLETLDYEGWGARPPEIALLLDRLATYQRVLIMSGDVHFAVSLGLRFWRRGQGLVSTVGQFTSSGVQYITFPEVLLPALGQGWANDLLGRGYPYNFLFWRDPVNPPISSPSLPARGLRRKLLHRPILVPTSGWPDDAIATIDPDFAWRLDLLEDSRPDAERPDPVRPEELPSEFDAADPLHGENGYAALARRHAAGVDKHTNTRRIGIFNKVARLTFRRSEQGRLVARSELISVDHHSESTAVPEPFTVHELVYDAPVDTPEPKIGD